MTDKKNHDAAPQEPNKQGSSAAADEKEILQHTRLTAGDDLLPIDPETGDIDIEQLTDEQREALAEANKRIAEAFKNVQPKITPGMTAFFNSMQKNKDAIRKSTGIDKILETFNNIRQIIFSDETRKILQQIRDNLQPIQDLIDEIDELAPFIKAELEKDEYGGLTYKELLEYTPGELLEMRHDPNSIFYKVVEAAKAAKAKAEHVTIQKTDNVEYPLDKISGKAWNLLTEDTGGQLAITFDLLPKKRDLQATAYYSINFDSLGDNVKITKRLQPYDKRVYIAVSALFNAGNDVITATQIYYAMGNTGKPAPNQIKKIDDSLSKMTGAKITLNNQQEHDALKGKYPLFQYDGSLLPIERITAIVNGQISESAIHIFREPPLMTFAKARKQVTTIDVKLLQSPISKTDANLSIDDYLIDRISRAKNGKGSSCRILFKTLYEHANIKTTKQKQRAPEKVKKYLTYYQQQEFIKRYTMQADGITVYF